MKKTDKFINDQLSLWRLACDNFRTLKNAEKRTLTIGGLDVVLQHNPARIVSSAAKVDAASIAGRKCFLCAKNRPAEQMSLDFEGRKGRKYDVLVNPYPIFAGHIVVAAQEHVPQSIRRRYVDMLDFARQNSGYTVFYNGPKCGASAPDHFHFQAARKGQMPLEKDADAVLDSVSGSFHDGSGVLEYMSSVRDADVFLYRKFLNGIFVLRSRTVKSAAKMFYRLLDCAPVAEGDSEPMFNMFAWYSAGEYRSIVVFRSAHRSHHYFSEGPDHLTMSPGCADMAGFLIMPVKEEFDRIDEKLLSSLLGEVSLAEDVQSKIVDRLTRTQPELSVGIMSAEEIEFEILADGAGKRRAVFRDGKVEYDGSVYDELFFEAGTPSTMFAEASFVLYGVTIGKGFHWERKENQRFAGALKIVAGKDCLTAVNVLGVEDYLVSVISSEMKSTASLEFLKAHAVISRSWGMARIAAQASAAEPVKSAGLPGSFGVPDSGLPGSGEDEFITWYGREEHDGFDVCADDHCQRYQGLTRAVGENVQKAVDATWGQVLTYRGKICDARFSKCCGGMMEKFSSCWEDRDYDYLQGIPDTFGGASEYRSLSEEASARQWIMAGDEDACCGNVPEEVLSQVLNAYDMETSDYFRWTEERDVQELSELFARKTGIYVGEIRALEPVERGVSGRIVRLRVVGSLRTVVIGKELEIRRALSVSHLKSSAFFAEFRDGKVIFHGAGWGHGVGLCQIGAANMAARGCSYAEILEHYYPGAEISGSGPSDGISSECIDGRDGK